MICYRSGMCREGMTVEKKIKELAVRFRNAIDAAKAAGEFDKDLSFNKFPRACCGDASNLLGEYLLENGIDSYYVCGTCYFDNCEEETQAHAWIQIDGLIVDITGDQFGDREAYYHYAERVYVGTGDLFHDLFEVEDRDIFKTERLEELDDFCYPRLKELYRIIKEYL